MKNKIRDGSAVRPRVAMGMGTRVVGKGSGLVTRPAGCRNIADPRLSPGRFL